MYAPRIQTRHLVLRPPRLRDSLAIYRVLRDPAMRHFTAGSGPIRPWYGVWYVLRSWLGGLRGRRMDHLGFSRETGELVLGFSVFRIDRKPPGSAESGLWVARPYWGARLGEEAAVPHYPAMFRLLGIRRFVALVAEDNVQGIKSTEQASRGWHFEGTLRHAYLHNGKWTNMRLYSLLPTDWGVREHLAAMDAERPAEARGAV